MACLTKKKHPANKETIFSFAYDDDLENAYAFYCARYRDITFDEFLSLGVEEFFMKFNSIPETEPLYTILKSRSINLTKIKDKEERKYWAELKRINKIPMIYISDNELERKLEEEMKRGKEIKQVNGKSNS